MGKAGATALGNMDLADRGGGGGQRFPQVQGLEDAAGSLRQGQGAVVIAGVCADRQRRGLDQTDPQILTVQRAGQAGADHAAANDQQIVVHIVHLPSRIHASMSSMALGAASVSTSGSSAVTSTSSSMRMPIRHQRSSTSVSS